MIKFIVAMDREAESLRKAGCTYDIHICGIGATNLPETTKEDVIVNVGYAGSVGLDIGTVAVPTGVFDEELDWFTTLDRQLAGNSCLCYTAQKFVEAPNSVTEAMPKNTVIDMELGKIIRLKYAELLSLKIVSDACNEKDCEAFNDEAAWKECWQKFKLWKRQKGIK